MDKEKAVSKLTELLAASEKLPHYSLHGDNSEFNKWHKDVEIALRHIFADDDGKHVQDFLGIKWTLSFFTSSTPDYQFENAHARGLNTAKALLKSYIDEVKEYWGGNNLSGMASESRLDALRNVLRRFHLVARQIRIRREGRPTLEINDEYDVQDLTHAILKLHFDDIRPEEYTPSYAGGSSRIDFLLDDSKIALEIKKTRQTLKDKQIGEELLIDVQRYKTHPSVQKLMCFVYDPEGLLINPSGLEKDLAEAGEQIETEIIISPKF